MSLTLKAYLIVEVSFGKLLKKVLSRPIGVISGFSVLDADITQSVKNTRQLKKELSLFKKLEILREKS